MIAPVLLDLDGEPIQVLGCECDIDSACNVAECLMERDFEMRSMFRWYQHQRAIGRSPQEIVDRVCA
jgi:hypothetical protein